MSYPATHPNRGWLWFFAAVAFVVVLAHESVVGAGRQTRAIMNAVPGFSCATMDIDVPGGSWSIHSHIMRSAVRMPSACLLDLKKRIRADRRFAAARCNLVERCWRRTEADRTYTFTFHPGYTRFHYAKD